MLKIDHVKHQPNDFLVSAWELRGDTGQNVPPGGSSHLTTFIDLWSDFYTTIIDLRSDFQPTRLLSLTYDVNFWSPKYHRYGLFSNVCDQIMYAPCGGLYWYFLFDVTWSNMEIWLSYSLPAYSSPICSRRGWSRKKNMTVRSLRGLSHVCGQIMYAPCGGLYWYFLFDVTWPNMEHSPDGSTIQLGITISIRIQLGIPTSVWYSTWNSNLNGDKFGGVKYGSVIVSQPIAWIAVHSAAEGDGPRKKNMTVRFLKVGFSKLGKGLKHAEGSLAAKNMSE